MFLILGLVSNIKVNITHFNFICCSTRKNVSISISCYEKHKYNIFITVTKYNRKIIETVAKSIPKTYMYMTVHFPGCFHEANWSLNRFSSGSIKTIQWLNRLSYIWIIIRSFRNYKFHKYMYVIWKHVRTKALPTGRLIASATYSPTR